MGKKIETPLLHVADEQDLPLLWTREARQALLAILQLRPEVVFLDVDPLCPQAIDLIRQGVAVHGLLPVVATTLKPSRELERAAFQAGAQYYIADPSSPSGAEVMRSILRARAHAWNRAAF